MDKLTYIELDVVCIIVLLLMYFSRINASMRSTDQRLFDWLILANAAVLFFDSLMCALGGRAGGLARGALITATSMYYVLNATAPMAWLMYCYYMTIGSARRLKRAMPIILIPLSVTIFMVVANLRWEKFYYIDSSNVYHRGEWFMIISAVALVYMAIATVLTIRQVFKAKNENDRRDARYLSMFMLWPIVGIVVQLLVYGMSLIYVCSTISILMVFINVQNRQIFSDELTGIANMRLFMRELPRRILSLDAGERLYAVMLDIDDFKGINDQLGHAAGDVALRDLAALLKKACAPRHDFVARTGGDEFQLLAVRKADEPFSLIGEINKLLASYNDNYPYRRKLEVSCGYSRYMDAGIDNADALMTASDKSMYAEKSAKKRANAAYHAT